MTPTIGPAVTGSSDAATFNPLRVEMSFGEHVNLVLFFNKDQEAAALVQLSLLSDGEELPITLVHMRGTVTLQRRPIFVNVCHVLEDREAYGTLLVLEQRDQHVLQGRMQRAADLVRPGTIGGGGFLRS